MTRHIFILPVVAILSVAGLPPARAQMPAMPGMSGGSAMPAMPGMGGGMGGGNGGMMGGAMGAMGSGAMGGAMGLPSLSSAGAGNLAGLLGYCVQNNYLGTGTASPVMSALSHKAGIDPRTDSQYQAGRNGLLDTGGGNTFSLAGAGQGIKQQMTQKICTLVLNRARSML